MKSRLANIFMGTALVFATGLIGWQTWTGNQMKTQLSQLQSQLQSIASQQMAGSNSGRTVPGTPQQGSSAEPLTSPVQPANPGGSIQVDPFGQGANADPFSDFDRIQQEMHQRMQQLLSGKGLADPFFSFEPFGSGSFGFSSSFGLQSQPQFNFGETEDAYVVTVDIPPESSLELTTGLNGQELTIEGKVTIEESNKTGNGAFSSRQTQHFARTFTLPTDVDPLGITNQTIDSKVIITIPRTQAQAPVTGPTF